MIPTSWFLYKWPQQNNKHPIGSPTDPSSYIKTNSFPPCTAGSDLICAIYAHVTDQNTPIIDDDLRSEIILALYTGQSRKAVHLRSIQ